jgi:hypothetical protein
LHLHQQISHKHVECIHELVFILGFDGVHTLERHLINDRIVVVVVGLISHLRPLMFFWSFDSQSAIVFNLFGNHLAPDLLQLISAGIMAPHLPKNPNTKTAK